VLKLIVKSRFDGRVFTAAEMNERGAAVTPYTKTDCGWLLDVHAQATSGGFYMRPIWINIFNQQPSTYLLLQTSLPACGLAAPSQFSNSRCSVRSPALV
jgi:hypothetical protein